MESRAPATDPPETIVSVDPERRSKAGMSSRSAADSAPEVMTVIASARTATGVSRMTAVQTADRRPR